MATSSESSELFQIALDPLESLRPTVDEAEEKLRGGIAVSLTFQESSTSHAGMALAARTMIETDMGRAVRCQLYKDHLLCTPSEQSSTSKFIDSINPFSKH